MYLCRAFSPSNHAQLRALPRAFLGPQKTYGSLFGATKESGEGANHISPGQRPGKGVIRKKGQGLKARSGAMHRIQAPHCSAGYDIRKRSLVKTAD